MEEFIDNYSNWFETLFIRVFEVADIEFQINILKSKIPLTLEEYIDALYVIMNIPLFSYLICNA